MYLSRVELGTRAAESEALWREVSSPYGAHQALWRLLGGGPDARREFLFRSEERPGTLSFLVLSAQRPNTPADGLWTVEAKPFAPRLAAGQRLGFRLRASAVVRRGDRVEGKRNRRVHRHDVVMDRAKRLEADGRPLPPMSSLVLDAGLEWLRSQGTRAGFRLADAEIDAISDDGLLGAEPASRAAVRVDGYRQHRVVRRGEAAIRFSTLDFEGVLEVTDPTLLLDRVGAGFGPQKAFGCGLMLLRRV